MGQILDQIFGPNFFYKIWLKFWDQNSGQHFKLNFGPHYLATLVLILAPNFLPIVNKLLGQVFCNGYKPYLNTILSQNLVKSEEILEIFLDKISD